MIKEDFIEKADQDGITIECISARLVKVLISIKLNFVMFGVALWRRPSPNSA